MSQSLPPLSRLALVLPIGLLAACASTGSEAWSDTTRPSVAVESRGAPPEAAAHPAPPPIYGPLPLEAPPEAAAPQTPPPRDEVGTPAAPQQQYYANLYRKWGFSAGLAAFATFNTQLRVSSPVLVGAILDLEDLLGVDSRSTVARLDGFYSFNDRHRIDMAYYDIRRSGSRAVAEDIEIGDDILPAGVIDTTFNTTIFKVAYRYNFVTDYRTVIGASFGLHTMRIQTGLKLEAGNIDEQSSFKALAPLPLIGLHGAYALSPKWRLIANAETLRVTIGSVEGFVIDTRLSLEHDTFEHLGWGVGFNNFTLSANVEGESGLNADIEYGYAGLMLYLRTYF